VAILETQFYIISQTLCGNPTYVALITSITVHNKCQAILYKNVCHYLICCKILGTSDTTHPQQSTKHLNHGDNDIVFTARSFHRHLPEFCLIPWYFKVLDKCFRSKLVTEDRMRSWLIDWVNSLTSHSTLNRTYRRRSSKPIPWLVVLRKSKLKPGEETTTIYTLSKNDTDVAHYNFNRFW